MRAIPLQVTAFLTLLYRGPPPPAAAAAIHTILASSPWADRAGLLSVPDIVAIAEHAAEASDAHAGTAVPSAGGAHFTSYDALRASRAKGITPASGPAGIFSEPCTLAQEVGWRAGEAQPREKRHSKGQTDITKFVAAAIATGQHVF